MKRLLFVLVIILIATAVMAQTIDTRLLDLSRAKTSVAGPDKIYIRSIYYNGVELSVILKYDGRTGAVIYGPYYKADKQIPDKINLGYVTFKIQDNNKIAISNIILNNRVAYSGVIKWEGGDKLNAETVWKSVPPKTKEQLLADLKEKNAALTSQYNKQVAQLTTQIEKLKASQVASVSKPSVQKKVQAFPGYTVFSGFKNGKALLGNWKTGYSTLSQTGVSQRFAKYSFNIIQNKSETLFGFTAKSSVKEKIGYGLHFFASGEKTGSGYGFGKSFLVWLTKDPRYYQSKHTYLQLYRSYDDIKMVQVASISIPVSINSKIKTDIIYNRLDNLISVYINGQNKLNYSVVSPIWSGNKIALRALGGPVEFSKLYVKTR